MPFNYYTIIIGTIVGLILFFKLPRLGKVNTGCEPAALAVSVIIPARNEEANLPGILGDLRNQRYRIFEVICIDDNSEDATADIIREYGAKCVKLNGLPGGWKGKTWACQNGAQTAAGDVLVFLDADVRLSKTAIESLVCRYQKTGKPISVLPYHAVRKPHEYFSLFFNLIKICATAMSIPGVKRTYGLYGPVFMVQKEYFDRSGGFEAVRNNVAEDLNLGRFYNRQGKDVDLLMGRDEISFRMYPSAFKDLFEGWSKNFSRGSISIRWWALLLIIVWIASLNAVPLEIARNLARDNYMQLLLLGGIHLLFAAMLWRIARQAGSYPFVVCLLYPVYLIVFMVIFINSIIATFITKTTTWKGRRM
jgi:4,4'-diaponeurosporenoate glycosyltransferase